MSSVSGGFFSEMPSASSSSTSSSSASATETVVVLNGLTPPPPLPSSVGAHNHQTQPPMGPGKVAASLSSQRANSSPSVVVPASSSSSSVGPAAAVTASPSLSATASSSNNSGPSPPLFTIVQPSLSASSRVVVATSGADSSLVASSSSSSSSALSPSGAKGSIVAAGSSSDSPQIIVVSEGDGSLDSTSNGTVGVTPGATAVNLGVGEAYVQYVDAPPAPRDPLYSHANGQIAYPVYTVGDTTMYAASSTYYTTGNTPVTFSQDIGSNAAGGPILTTGNNTFLLQQDVDNDPPPIITPSRHSPQTEGGVTYMVSGDGGSTPSGEAGIGHPNLDAEAQTNIAHATRVSPITVQWLLDNYETAEGVSLPRSTLYNHYLYHCADHKLDPVNSASFGKLIRSVFMGLRTRRLGTRGNSKYHYYGIRIKPNSNLNNLSEDGTLINFRQQGASGKKNQVLHHPPQEASQHVHQQGRSIGAGGIKNDSYESHLQVGSEPSPQTVQNQQFLGDVHRALPILPEIPMGSHNNGLSKHHIESFRSLYQEHCESILDVIYNLQFHLMETIWRRFWGSGNNNNVVVSGDKTNSSEGSEEDEGELASKFSSSVLQNLLRSPAVLEFIKSVDYQFYQNLVKVLIPDVLRSIPPTLTQSIRNFAKSLEGWLTSALVTYPPELVEVKLCAVASLAQTLRRYTSLNHLAQAARAVLQNSSQITQMLSDLNRVDFHNVQEQASWVCQCDVSLVERLEEDFKATLQQQNSLEQWAEWLQTVVDQTLTPQETSPDFARHARQFLLKWSFYSSMVIRDLTLRSAASFGSFHLIRLLYDEYMFYLVEHKVASSLGLTPIAVMSQFLSSSKVQNLGQPNLSMNGDDPLLPNIKRPKFEES